ncbi:hypothetical protein PHSY_006528 [Pseudozyma hubeiensis SY62]|uniref:Uncharacterized protein n=1 Tax=Pseudozyma hubeiensis (strain SY62) TaxID=1305764 RepID=R9PC36_PSEHS|nr:hypothetical protein PHSY_006528 [Pseudozyma hubeiensis SY62]GAC98931.1 hypothetical protein PHSY_006528 [Pseudozyma hubeiensis SY62]
MLRKTIISMVSLLICTTVAVLAQTTMTQNTTDITQITQPNIDSAGLDCRRGQSGNESSVVIFEDHSQEEDLPPGILPYNRSGSPLTGLFHKRLQNCGGASGHVVRPNRDIGNCLVSNWKGTRSQHNCPGKYYLACKIKGGYCGQIHYFCGHLTASAENFVLCGEKAEIKPEQECNVEYSVDRLTLQCPNLISNHTLHSDRPWSK